MRDVIEVDVADVEVSVTLVVLVTVTDVLVAEEDVNEVAEDDVVMLVVELENARRKNRSCDEACDE